MKRAAIFALLGILLTSAIIATTHITYSGSASSPQPTVWDGSSTWPQMGGRLYMGGITWNAANYWIASTYNGGWFKNGQNADIMLSGYGFDNANSSLSLFRSGYLATDGMHLVLSDPSNNRILIWNNPPASDMAPDLVLGQENFTSNLSGNATNQFAWPLGVSTAGNKLVVADAYNNRILIWNTFPTNNDQPADLQIACCQWFGLKNGVSTPYQNWPWAVWTDGTRLVVTATKGGYVFIWNSFPTVDNQPPNIYLTGTGLNGSSASSMGTPRSIISDGKELIVTDESAHLPNGTITAGTWFWNTFPTTNDSAPSFLMTDPLQGTPYGVTHGTSPTTRWGTITSSGELIMTGSTGPMIIYNSVPTTERAPDLIVGTGCDLGYTGLYRFCEGDGGGGAVYAGGRLYVSESYGSKLVVFNSLPTSPTANPDFAIGAPDVNVNTIWASSMVNPNPVSDGQSLLVSSPYSMQAWENLPDQSGVLPDVSYDNPSCDSQAAQQLIFRIKEF